MNCIICEKPTNRKVKDLIVCPDCIKTAQGVRDHLNNTRTRPKTNFNPQGEDPVTLVEVIIKTIMMKESNNETT